MRERMKREHRPGLLRKKCRFLKSIRENWDGSVIETIQNNGKEQEIIALHWIAEMKIPTFIETIKDDMKWEKSFWESQGVLEILADKALEEIREGKAEYTGWDEL